MEVVIRDKINDIASFIENEAIMMLLSKESKYRAEYNFFKDKYKAEFEEYEKKVRESKQENFEVEDDLMDWEFAYRALKGIEEKRSGIDGRFLLDNQGL